MLTPEAFDAMLVTSIRMLAEHAAEKGRSERRDGVTIAAVGRGGEEFNVGFVTDRPQRPEETLGWARDRLTAASGSGWMLQLPDEWGEDLAPVLKGLGTELSHTSPGLARPATAEVPPPPPDLRVVPVTDRDQLVAATLAMATGFGAPDASPLEGVFSPSLLDDERMVFLCGHLAGDPVPAVTGVAVTTDDVVGVFGITVQPAARRRGHGAAMTWACVAEGARRGARTAILQASDMGLPMYLGMGFEQVRRHRRYVPTTATSPASGVVESRC